MLAYKKVSIYYFSGTGNSKNVAKWLVEFAKTENIEADMHSIDKLNRLNIPNPDPEALLIFISPVHGFNYPPVMIHFLRHFPKGKNKVVLMNTRAGMIIGQMITPGLTGVAFYLSGLILKLKGYKIVGLRPVDLPSNWISFHPGLTKRAVRLLHIKNKKRIRKFAKKIFAGKRSYKALLEIIQDIAISPISVAYYFIGRFFLAKTFYASNDCTDCGLCIKQCPVQAIKKVGNRHYWTLNCESCMRCMSNCPEKAIETAHGFVIGLVILFNTVISVSFYKFMSHHLFTIENRFLLFLIDSAVFILFIGLSYYLFHYLLRFRIFERLIVYTSFTKFKFWGRRYKALKDKDFE